MFDKESQRSCPTRRPSPDQRIYRTCEVLVQDLSGYAPNQELASISADRVIGQPCCSLSLSAVKFIVLRAGEAYDAPARKIERKFPLQTYVIGLI
jgi:hypothetical protein